MHIKDHNFQKLFPDFDDEDIIKALKGWRDVSDADDKMPSFETRDLDGHIYKIMVNYPVASDWKARLHNNHRLELLKDGKHFSSWNELHWLLKEFREISETKDSNKGKGLSCVI